jgi:hypothetical protein
MADNKTRVLVLRTAKVTMNADTVNVVPVLPGEEVSEIHKDSGDPLLGVLTIVFKAMLDVDVDDQGEPVLPEHYGDRKVDRRWGVHVITDQHA